MVAINYERCSLVVSMPYSKQCVNEIKEQLPAHTRWWDPTDQVWYVSPAYLSKLVQILRGFFEEDEIYIDRGIPDMTTLRDALEPEESPYSELHLYTERAERGLLCSVQGISKALSPGRKRGRFGTNEAHQFGMRSNKMRVVDCKLGAHIA